MSAESIIKVNVDDSKFKEFSAAFNKYKEALKTLPKSWGATNSAISKGAADADKSFKAVLKTQKDLNKSVNDGVQGLKEAAKVSGVVAANLASGALSVAKWVALGVLGGGFGLGTLASSASNARRQAQGYGISTGDLRSTTTNFGKYIDSEGTLSRIADMQNDLSRRQVLGRLGGKDGQNAAQMLPSLIKNAVKEFNSGGKSPQYADAVGLTQIFSMEDLRRLSSLTESELQKTIADFQRDREALKVSDEDSQAMQNFWIQIKRSAEAMETGLIKALSPLVPQLTALSEAITKAITDFLGSKEVQKALKDFTNWIGSPEAKEAIKSFIDGLVEIGKMMARLVNWFSPDKESAGKSRFGRAGVWAEKIVNNLNPFIQARTLAASLIDRDKEKRIEGLTKEGKIDFSRSRPETLLPANNDNAISERFNNPGNLRKWGNTPIGNTGSGSFAKFATKEAGLKAMAAQLKLYQNRDGLNTIDGIVSKWAPNNENNTSAYINSVAKRSGYGANEKIDLNNTQTLSKVMSAMTKQENHRSNYTPEVINNVLVTNAAGSDLVVSSNTMK